MDKELQKERHQAKMKQLEIDRKALFEKHKLYLEIVNDFGRGIMIKPHLEQYIITFTKCSNSKFNKDLKKLIDLKLLCLETTQSASIIVITKPALMLLGVKTAQKEISLSGVWTESNFKRSVVKNEYVLKEYVAKCSNYRELRNLLKETNLIKPQGDNIDIAKAILDRAQMTTNAARAERDYQYIKAVFENKKSNLKNSRAEKTTVTRDKDTASINNLQSRHMYITDSNEFFEIAYLEISKKINYEKMKSDMDMLSKCLQHIPVEHLTIDIVVGATRGRMVEKIVAEWKKKRWGHFIHDKNGLTINIIALDVDNKYFRGTGVDIF